MNLDKRTLKILKRIYRVPYITLPELKLLFPRPDTEELVLWLEAEHYISAREADRADNDKGYEVHPLDANAHFLSLRKGNIAAEDPTAFRARAALIISVISLAVSIFAAILPYIMQWLGLLR